MTGRQATGLALIGAGVAAGGLWASGRLAHPFAPVVALVLFLAGASFFGKASQFADKLRPLVGKHVRVRVWGLELHDRNSGSSFRVHMVRAIGPGLHFYLRPSPEGSPIHLKVAQPSGTRLGDTTVEISGAKYVQWAGKKIKKDEREKAFVLVIQRD